MRRLLLVHLAVVSLSIALQFMNYFIVTVLTDHLFILGKALDLVNKSFENIVILARNSQNKLNDKIIYTSVFEENTNLVMLIGIWGEKY